jgi:fused signal recognition particle receptor
MKSSGVTGLVVTKLDGTAKGGILFSICQELGIPVRYIGIGESLEDLLEFSADTFVDSLFSETPAFR